MQGEPPITARALFDELADLDRAGREARLAAVALTSPELADEVRTLLSAHRAAHSFLETPAVATPGAIEELTTAEPAESERRIGPWRLLGRLGEGGMGEVHLAERDDGSFRRRVAIKLVRGELRSQTAIARFRRERELLARLDHPNVARLLDGGVTAAGRPYLVMELVHGLRIDRWCDRSCATIEERLRLFLEFCAAVGHAHRNLIVHRDLKPANVLVAESTDRSDGMTPTGPPTVAIGAGDGLTGVAGQVKLLDFGIAKLLGDAPDELAETLTRTAAPAFTPRYAAPEQLTGEPVTTATDIYAIGVMLYELLCGLHPYPPGDWEKTRHAIREIDPPPPSMRASRRDDLSGDRASDGEAEVSARAALRRLDPPRLQRRLAGDLDTIVQKAMHKDPQRRYATVEALADDLRRHLAGEPVLARPATVGYRLRRLVRRNRVAVGVGVAVFTAMAIGGAVATAGLVRAVAAGRLAEEQRVLAVAAAADATRQARATRLVLDFLAEDLIAAASIDSQHAYDVPLRELLEVASSDVGARFGDEPGLRASVDLMLGQLFLGLSQTDSAAPHIESAFDLRTGAAVNGGATAVTDQERFEAMMALVELRVEQGRHDDAAALLRTASEVATTAAQRAAIANGIGYLSITLGRYDEAVPPLREAVGLADAVPAGDALIHRANLAWAHHGAGQYAEAVSTYREVLEQQRAMHGPTNFRVLRTMNNLGHALIDADRRDEAEVLLREAIVDAAASLPDDQPLRITLDNNLALSLGQARAAEAITIFESVLERQGRRLAPGDPDVLRTRNNIAMNRLALGDHAGALADLRAVHALRAEVLGETHPSAISTLANVAYALYLAGRHAEADPIYREALALRERTLGPNHPMTVSTMRFTAGNLIRAGDSAAALALVLEALRRAPEAYGDDPAPVRALEEMRAALEIPEVGAPGAAASPE